MKRRAELVERSNSLTGGHISVGEFVGVPCDL